MMDAGKEIARIREAARYLEKRVGEVPKTAVVLGSGLGAYADRLDDREVIPYTEIPNFPVSSVQGHAGRLVFGKDSGVPVAVMQGRVHLYEGYKLADVVRPVRILSKLGVKFLMITNAAGGVNPDFSPGDLMVIEDHLNLTGANPLTGPNIDELGTRFPDMSEAYDHRMRELAEVVAGRIGIELKKGVYAWLTGPSYETPSEVRMLQMLGADATGMSTVPEVIAGVHAGLKVLGISCITNKAAGLSQGKLGHDEVKETAERIEGRFVELVSRIVREIEQEMK